MITLALIKEKDLPKSKSETSINLLMKYFYLKEVMETDYFLAVVEKSELAERKISFMVHPIF